MRQIRFSVLWFTLTELLVSIVISVLVLGWIFYFISETLLGLARTSSESDFLKSFYTFSAVLESWEFEIIPNNWYHVWLIESPITWDGIIVWVIDATNLKLIPTPSTNLYLPSVIAYRQLSADEITTIRSSPNSIYSLEFEKSRVFNNFFVNRFELTWYNYDDALDAYMLYELELEIFPIYYETLRWFWKSEIKIEDIQSYSLIF